MKKEIVFSSKLDTAEFDRSIEQMQKKLREIYAPADMIRAQSQTASRLTGMGLGGNLSQPSFEGFQKATQQSRRDLDQLIKEQATGQEKLGKMISQRIEKLKELKTQQAQMVKDSIQELEIKKQIGRVEENNMRLKEVYMQRNASLNQAMDSRNKLAPRDIGGIYDAFRSGGFRHGMSTIPGAFRMNPLGMGGALIGGIGTAMAGGSEMYRQFAGMPIRTEAAMGNAVQATLGQDVQNVYARRSAFENMYAPERARASQMALRNAAANQLADKGALAGNLGAIGGGAALTAATGGMGALGGLALAGKGLWGLLGSERQSSLLLSPFSTTASNRYNSQIAEKMASDYQNTLEAEKRQNPYKRAAIGEYEKNFMRDLGVQRMMGLSNEGFRGNGGFMQNAIGSGFTPEMSMEMASGIQGSGGSTRMMREAAFGLRMQRGMDMTNSGQILGTLSGGIGSSESTKQATVKILAEGMRLGLDDSKFAEENRRFTQAAAEIVARSGASSEGDFSRVSGGFSRFMGENTAAGIGAAKTAYEQYQQVSSSVTGPRGVMRAAGFLSDPDLNKLPTIDKQAIMQLREEELNTSNPMVAGMAERIGISPDQLISKIQGVNRGSVSRFKEADQLRDTLKSRGIDVGRTGDPSYMASLTKEDRQDVSRLMAFQMNEFGNQGQREMISRASGIVGKPEIFGPGVGDSAVMTKLGSESGRQEDNTIAAMAGDASTVLKNFNAMSGEMDAAARSAAKFTDQVREMNAALIQALERANAGGSNTNLDVLKQLLNKNASSLQSQAGKQK